MRDFLLTLLLPAMLLVGCKKGGDGATTLVKSITLNKSATTIPVGGSEQLSVTEALPSKATDKSVTWNSDNTARATVDNNTGEVTVPATATSGTVVITATANDGSGVQASCTVTVSGILINGVTWATCNVDAFGTFAAAPESSGMLYQWNRTTAWLATGDDPVSSPVGATWNGSDPPGDAWVVANDPCPPGWRVPDQGQLDTLLDSNKVEGEWTTVKSVNGYKFTDKTSGYFVFFPAAGYRLSSNGMLYYADNYGYYWSGSSLSTIGAWYLYVYSDLASQLNSDRTYGFSLRCVHP